MEEWEESIRRSLEVIEGVYRVVSDQAAKYRHATNRNRTPRLPIRTLHSTVCRVERGCLWNRFGTTSLRFGMLCGDLQAIRRGWSAVAYELL